MRLRTGPAGAGLSRRWRLPLPSQPLAAGMWAYFTIGTLIGVAGPSLESLRAELGFTYALVGPWLAGATLGFVAGTLLGGVLSDRFGRREVLVGAHVVGAAGILAAALSPSFLAFVAFNGVASLGLGAVDAAVPGLLSDSSGRRAARAIAVSQIPFALGALATPPTVGALLAAGAGWRPGYLIVASFLLLGALAFAVIRYPPTSWHAARLPQIVRAVAAPAPLLLGAALALYVGFEFSIISFLAAFLETEFAMPRAPAASLVSAFWLGQLLGRLGGPWAVERIDLYKFTMGSLVLTAAFAAALTLAPSVPVTVVAAGLAAASGASVFPAILAIAIRRQPAAAAAMTGGVLALAALGSLLFPLVAGFVADAVSLRAALIAAPIAAAAAGLVLLAARRMDAPAAGG